MNDAGVDPRDRGGEEAREARWSYEGVEAVSIPAAGAEPAAVLHRHWLIESERLEVPLFLRSGVLRVERIFLLGSAWGGEEEGVDEDGGAKHDRDAERDALQSELDHVASSLFGTLFQVGGILAGYGG